MSLSRVKFLILGAGPTGLGGAYRLKELGEDDFLIIEREGKPGGLSASFLDGKGFTWDLGGHVHFSHYEYFNQVLEMVLDPNFWFNLERDSRIWINQSFVPFPLQNNIAYLPIYQRINCLIGNILSQFRNQQKPSENFHDWILNNFGSGLAALFLFPYNLKVWSYPLEKMSTNWVEDRVSPLRVWDSLKNFLIKKPRVSWGPNRFFRFPQIGGTGAVWEKLAANIGKEKIRFHSPVRRIDFQNKTIFLDTEAIQFEHLLCSIPLNQLVQMLIGFPDQLKELSKHLQYSSSHFIGVGLEGSEPKFLDKACWIYFPGKIEPFYRVTMLSHYSRNCVPNPDRNWSLLLEVAESHYFKDDLTALEEKCLRALKINGYIKPDNKVVSIWHHREEFGYPIPTLDRDDILRSLQKELEKKSIYSRGRFGGWKYEIGNQDHSFMQGVEAVNRIVEQKKETVYSL